jgi:predicted lactoylglutathione lyase
MITLECYGITAEDLHKSVEFYTMLGLVFPSNIAEDEDHVEADLGNGMRFMIDSLKLVKSMYPDWQPPTGHRSGICFNAKSPTGVDAYYAKIVAAGYEGKSEPWDAF